MTTPLDRTPELSYRCGDTDTLLAYVYDDAEPEIRREIDRHLEGCDSCAEQARQLRGARGSLQAWHVPATPGFRLVAADAAMPPPVEGKRSRPVWSWAAAAVLILAAAGALANLEVQTGPSGFALRLGWAGGSGDMPTEAAEPVMRADLLRVEADLQNIKSQLDRLGETATRAQTTASSDAARGDVRRVAEDRADVDELMRRVRELVEESERRQQRELALRLMQVSQEYQDQRLIDLATINQGFNQLDYLVNVSSQR